MKFDRWYSYDTVGSTMDIAREKALAGEPAGAIIVASYQTGGRGRQGRTWFAPHGANVCITVIGARVLASEAWQVGLLAGVATAEAVIARTKLPASVRFPNDIYLVGKKLGGILIETAPHSMAGYVIPLIGIGVNVNVKAEQFSPELSARATSTLIESGEEHSVPFLTARIVLELAELWEQFRRGPIEEAILPQWRNLSNPENRRTFQINGNPHLCQILDIASNGLVTLSDESGNPHTLHAAQVILGDD